MLPCVQSDLSDVKVAEALNDRVSFRGFYGFSPCERTAERTAFVRFRKALVERGPDRVLVEQISAQLRTRTIQVKTGQLVDAPLIAWANTADEDARRGKHKSKPAMHGFKAHMGAGADTGLVEEVAITPASSCQ